MGVFAFLLFNSDDVVEDFEGRFVFFYAVKLFVLVYCWGSRLFVFFFIVVFVAVVFIRTVLFIGIFSCEVFGV